MDETIHKCPLFVNTKKNERGNICFETDIDDHWRRYSRSIKFYDVLLSENCFTGKSDVRKT